MSTILYVKSFTNTLPLTVQQSEIFLSCFSFLVSNASEALRAVKSSLRYSWASLCCLLWCFRTVRAQQTVSRIRSVLKRMITARVRGRPSLSVFGPSRCDLSMSAKASGGVKHMVSLITNYLVIGSTAS